MQPNPASRGDAGLVRSQRRLTANSHSERNVMSQLRAACGGLLSNSASIHSVGSNAIGLSPYAVRKRSRIELRMRYVPALFEAKNCCESKYSATTALALPGLARPAPVAVRGPASAA